MYIEALTKKKLTKKKLAKLNFRELIFGNSIKFFRELIFGNSNNLAECVMDMIKSMD